MRSSLTDSSLAKKTDTLVVWGSLFPHDLNVLFLLTVDFVSFQLAVKVTYSDLLKFVCFTEETIYISLPSTQYSTVE